MPGPRDVSGSMTQGSAMSPQDDAMPFREDGPLTRKIRVLLVDDEEQFVLNLARLLRFRGFDVSTALSGYEAIDTIRKGDPPDAVVLDIKMPGMDGIKTLREIKVLSPDTEVIMLTGHATISSGTQAMREGAYDYLIKPCDIEDLVEKIQEAYEAESIKRHPILWPRKTVQEITLHSFKRLRSGDTILQAFDLMKRGEGETAIEELYILDAEDRPVGVITKQDLLLAAQAAHTGTGPTWSELRKDPHRWLPMKTLGEVMRQEIITVSPEAYLTDAGNKMIIHKIRSMPVISGEKMIGIIRMQDIFHYVEHEIE